MSTIVIYSGEARSFAQTFPNQYFHLLRHLDDPQFFVSVADDAQAPDMVRMLRTRFPADRIHFEAVVQPTLPEPPPDPPFMGFLPSVPPQAILRQLWSLQRAWLFTASKTLFSDDPIIRIRPDLAFTRINGVYSVIDPNTCFTPWWARWGGINDRLAIMGSAAAESYFNTYPNIKYLMGRGCPLHPETMLAEQLAISLVDVHHTLATEFFTVRLDGTTRPAEISGVEIAEYARTRL